MAIQTEIERLTAAGLSPEQIEGLGQRGLLPSSSSPPNAGGVPAPVPPVTSPAATVAGVPAEDVDRALVLTGGVPLSALGAPTALLPAPVPATRPAALPGGLPASSGDPGVQLERLRAQGLDDATIRAGTERGLFPPGLRSLEPAAGQGGGFAPIRAGIEAEQVAIERGGAAEAGGATEQAQAVQAAIDVDLASQAERDADEVERQGTAREELAKLRALQDDLRNDRVRDPWADKSTGAKILAVIGLVLGGIGAGLTGGPNQALQVIENAIERDISIQKARIGRKRGAVSAQFNFLSQMRDVFGDERQAEAAARVGMLERAKLKIQKIGLGSKAEVARSTAAQVVAQLDQKLAVAASEFQQATETKLLKQQAEKRRLAALESISRNLPISDEEPILRALLLSGDPKLAKQGIEQVFKAGQAEKPFSELAKLGVDLRANSITQDQYDKRVSQILADKKPTLSTVVGGIIAKFQKTGKISEDDKLILVFQSRLNPFNALLIKQGMGALTGLTDIKGESLLADDDAPISAPSKDQVKGVWDSIREVFGFGKSQAEEVQPKVAPKGATGTSAAGKQTLLRQAREAIGAGKDPESVRAKLRELGVDPGEL